MKFLSVCSGIEAASVAWEPMGWKAVAFAEIEPFPAAVLAHHYPAVPNFGDMTQLPDLLRAGVVDLPDMLCGGTPCQAFSVAGLRKSLSDARGNLSLTFCEIANAIDDERAAAGLEPGIIFWENVPGVLSTADNAFGCFLAALAGESEPLIAPGGKWTNAGAVFGPQRAVAWRILDAQYFGVAQRRRRVFVVASARDDFDPAAVLFEFDGVRRDTAPSREAGKAATPSAAASAGVGGEQPYSVANTLTARMHKGLNSTLDEGQTPVVTHSLRGEGFDASEDGTGRGTPLAPVAFSAKDYGGDAMADLSPTLRAGGHSTSHANAGVMPAIAFHPTQDPISSENVCHSIGANDNATAAVAVALRGREGGATAELGDEVQNCLRASQGGGDKPHVLCEALYNKGFNHESTYASTQETNAGKILRALREAVGEEAFAKWGLGILDSLQSPEILRQALHGVSVRPASFTRSWVVHCALSRQEDGSGWLLQSLRETGCEGCPPQGWEPPEQLARQLGAYLSELSQPGAQASRFMRDLWWAAQGTWVLRQALSAVKEVGRPAHGQSQPAYGGMQVRRLTVEECEFLQGFPRGYTAIPWRKKSADQCPDGPRYKALGNSWAVPVVRWIGRRIDLHLMGLL